MIRSKALLIFTSLVSSALLACAAPNSLRYSVDEALVTTGIDPDARGRVQVSARKKGNADVQRLRLAVAKLDPKTPYVLLARIGDDPNPVTVSEFITTSAGRAVLVQLQKPTQPAASPRALAAEMSPLSGVRALAIANTNGEVILSVNLHESPSMQFEFTSVLQNTGIDPTAVGCLALGWQNGFLQFRLLAAGQGSGFTLYVNDHAVASYPAAGGRIVVGAFPPGAPSPLDFHKVSLRNDADEIVLEQTVP
jgi:hypothetical protein